MCGLVSCHISDRQRLRNLGAVNRPMISCAGLKQVYGVSITQIPICAVVVDRFGLELVAAIFTDWHFFKASYPCAVCCGSDSF